MASNYWKIFSNFKIDADTSFTFLVLSDFFPNLFIREIGVSIITKGPESCNPTSLFDLFFCKELNKQEKLRRKDIWREKRKGIWKKRTNEKINELNEERRTKETDCDS